MNIFNQLKILNYCYLIYYQCNQEIRDIHPDYGKLLQIHLHFHSKKWSKILNKIIINAPANVVPFSEALYARNRDCEGAIGRRRQRQLQAVYIEEMRLAKKAIHQLLIATNP